MEKNIREFLNEFSKTAEISVLKMKLRVLRKNLQENLSYETWTKYNLETNQLHDAYDDMPESQALQQYYELTDQSGVIKFINWMLNEPEDENDE